MRYDYYIIVIGAGSGGLVVASGAASLGARVALIEAEKMGGDCLNAGCVPSKTFLKSAHIAKAIQDASMYGLTADLKKVDLAAVMGRVNKVIRQCCVLVKLIFNCIVSEGIFYRRGTCLKTL